MERPWAPQREVSAAEAAILIADQFPQLRGCKVEPLGTGWDNSVFMVDSKWAFRFPRRQIAVSLLDNERLALTRIADHLPLAVPRPVFVGAPSERFAWPFVGYTLVPGQTACRTAIAPELRRGHVGPLAEFLRILHALPCPEGLPDDELARVDIERRLSSFVERLEALTARGVIETSAPWRRFLAEHPPLPPDATARLVHGDLYARHILVDERGLPSGVIDWGDVHRGHPGLDLSIAFGYFEPVDRALFFRHYGDVSASTLRLARLRASFHAVALAAYGLDIGDADLLREGVRAMQLVLLESWP